MIACSTLNGATGDLLLKHNGDYHSGFLAIPTTITTVYIKPPPTVGAVRVMGELGVVMESRQFSYDVETSLFGWLEKKVYREFLPLALKRADSFSVFSAMTIGKETGIQEGVIVLYDPNIFNLPMEVDCKGNLSTFKGIGHCRQLEGTTAEISIKNPSISTVYFGIVRCEDDKNVLELKPGEVRTEKLTINSCESVFSLYKNNKILFTGVFFPLIEDKTPELPRPEKVGKSITFGIGSSLIQCGNKHHEKKPTDTLKVKESCYRKRLYQWGPDGRFLFTE